MKMTSGSISAIKGIKFVSLHEAGGYGTAARRYLLGLKKSRLPFTWTPMVPGRGWNLGYEPFKGRSTGDPELDLFCNAEIEYDRVIVHMVPEYYPLWAKREPGKIFIGYTVWETDKLPRHWPDLLNSVDHLLVPCRWNKEVFRRSGVTVPIHVIPHIVNLDRTDESCRLPGISPDEYVFYTIGAWTARKAVWHAVECYLDTFSGDDSTVLIVKTTRKDLARPLLNRWRLSTGYRIRKMIGKRKNPARIEVITDEISETDILKLHGAGDCYISLTRSEGWGMGAFDAATFGRPVIITGFGGPLAYLPEESAYLVDYDPVPVCDRLGRKSYTGDQTWAEPRLAHASRLMREVFADRDEARARGKALQEHIRQNFGETMIMEKLLSVISPGFAVCS